MKRIVLCLFCFGVALSSCRRDKDLDMTLVQKTMFENESFDAISADDAWTVTVVQDSVRRGVEVEYSAFLEPYLKISKEGSRLNIGFNTKLYLPAVTVFNAKVYVQSLQDITLEEGSCLTLEGAFSGARLTVELDEAAVLRGGVFMGDVSIVLEEASTMADFIAEGSTCQLTLDEASVFKGNLTAFETLDIAMDDASRMTLYGISTPNANVHLANASMLNMVRMNVAVMEIHLQTASEATVSVSNSLTGSLNEASCLYYQGNPTINLECDLTSSYQPL